MYQVSKSKFSKIIFNLGSDDKCIKIFSLAKKISKIINKKIKLIKSTNESGSPVNRVPDIGFIKKNFNIKFIKIDQGLLKTYNWYKKNMIFLNEPCLIGNEKKYLNQAKAHLGYPLMDIFEKFCNKINLS